MIVKTKQLKFWAQIKFSRTSTHTLGHEGKAERSEKPLKTLDKLDENEYSKNEFSRQNLDQEVSKGRCKNRQNIDGKKWVALLPQFAINLKRLSLLIRDLIQKIFENHTHKLTINIKTIGRLIVAPVNVHTELRSH